jgi:hypothetical protein
MIIINALYREIIAIRSDYHTKHINTLCTYNARDALGSYWAVKNC